MKRNSWKRLLAILGAASILTVSINPVRINAGGSDLPIVSAEGTSGTNSEGSGEASSDSAEGASVAVEDGDASGSKSTESEGANGNGEKSPTGDQDGSSSGSQGDTVAEGLTDASKAGSDTQKTVDADDTSISQAGTPDKADDNAGEKTADEKDDAKTIHVTYVSADDTMGAVDVSGEDSVISEDTGKVNFSGATATANEGYEFVNWTVAEDGETVAVSTEPKLVPVDVTEDTTYTANFREEKKKTITITYAAGEGGKVAPGSESFEAGKESEAKLTGSTAEASEGYTFLGWVKGEDPMSRPMLRLSPMPVRSRRTPPILPSLRKRKKKRLQSTILQTIQKD